MWKGNVIALALSVELHLLSRVITIIALIISIVFQLVNIQSHDKNQFFSFFNEHSGTTSVFPMCLFLDFMQAGSVLFEHFHC